MYFKYSPDLRAMASPTPGYMNFTISTPKMHMGSPSRPPARVQMMQDWAMARLMPLSSPAPLERAMTMPAPSAMAEKMA